MSFESRFRDVPRFHPHRQAQYIAANWIYDFDGGGSVRYVTSIVRVPKMFEDRFIEHK